MASQALIEALLAEITTEVSRRAVALATIARIADELKPDYQPPDYRLTPRSEAQHVVIGADHRIQRLGRALSLVCDAGATTEEMDNG